MGSLRNIDTEIAVAKPSTKNADNLKLYTEQPAKVVRPQIEAVGSLPAVLRAFEATTGWSLRYVDGEPQRRQTDQRWSAPVSPGVGVTLGHLSLEPLDHTPAEYTSHAPAATKPIDRDTARSMAAALADLLAELMQTRRALWQREAELAAGVPLIPHTDEQKHLAERLEAVLRGGAEAVDCHAAALYMLDEATTELKLRASWGLPFDRLTAPARPLKGAMADLEALLGHAVVLEDTTVMQHWRVPEDFPAAVCVPVSTPTTLLGTLWVYCNRKRDFTDRQTNVIEVVAGRLAADLEREMLMCEGIDAAQLKNQLASVQRMQRNQSPTISPVLDGWELSGWSDQSQSVGSNFYDWFCLPDGLLAVAVGDAIEDGLQGAMAAAELRSAVRAHGQYHRKARETIKQVNMTLWTGSAGDRRAALCYGLIETATGRINYAQAGRPGAVVVRKDGWQSLGGPSPPLGEGPETDYEQGCYQLQPGEVLVMFTDGVCDAIDREGRQLGISGIAEPLLGRTNLSADRLATVLRETVSTHTSEVSRHDRAVLVLKRD